jgi:hypothetical protein
MERYSRSAWATNAAGLYPISLTWFVLFDDSADDGPFVTAWTAREASARPGYDLVFKRANYLPPEAVKVRQCSQ